MNVMRRLSDIKNTFTNFILIFRYIILDNNVYYEMSWTGISISSHIDTCTVIPVITLSIATIKFLRVPVCCSKDLPNSFVTLLFSLSLISVIIPGSFITLEKLNILLKYSLNKWIVLKYYKKLKLSSCYHDVAAFLPSWLCFEI